MYMIGSSHEDIDVSTPASGGRRGTAHSTGLRSERPDHFSTYAPREVVRRLKVVAAIQDVPLWAVVTDALEGYLESYQRRYGPLPRLAGSAGEDPPGED